MTKTFCRGSNARDFFFQFFFLIIYPLCISTYNNNNNNSNNRNNNNIQMIRITKPILQATAECIKYVYIINQYTINNYWRVRGRRYISDWHDRQSRPLQINSSKFDSERVCEYYRRILGQQSIEYYYYNIVGVCSQMDKKKKPSLSNIFLKYLLLLSLLLPLRIS